MVVGDGRGEAALWAAVLLQVIVDATSNPAPTQAEALRARAEALTWLHGPMTTWKRAVVTLAGVDPEAFFTRARAGLIKSPAEEAHRRGRKRRAA